MAHFKQLSISPLGGEVGQYITEKENYFQTLVFTQRQKDVYKKGLSLLPLIINTFNSDGLAKHSSPFEE